MAEKLYTIKKIAECFGVSTDTLKIYEEKGLFIPKSVDGKTNYRYYEAAQTCRLRTILTLKSQGFSLDEIKEMLDSEISAGKKHRKILTKYQQLQYVLSQYDLYLPQSKKEAVKTIIWPQHYKICRDIEASGIEEVMAVFNSITDEVIEHQLRWVVPSYPYCVYDDEDFRRTNHCSPSMKIHQPKGEKLSFKTASRIGESRECKCLSVIHRGAYENLREAYNILDTFALEHTIPVKKIHIEQYIVNKDNLHLTNTLITEVLLPIDDSVEGRP